MIENTDQYPSMPSDGNDGDAFPTFFRPPADTDVDPSNHDLSGAPFSYETGHTCTVALAGELIEKIRKAGEEAEVQQQHEVPLTPKAGSKPTAPASSQVQQPISKPVQPEKKKNKNDSADHQQLIDRLNKKPHVIEFKGVVLDRNERLKIIAAVALCESGQDPFSAENLDTEFHMKPSASLSYGRIVHIGLSYGVIQFTQDSGSLGKLLQRMQQKDTNKFTQVFGDNYQELITLTTTGVAVSGVDYPSGQSHWNSIRRTADGKNLSSLAGKNSLPKRSEIRGKRVQPIAITIGGSKQDLWEGTWKQRFSDAGKVGTFQEAELEFAVEAYMNPALKFCETNNIRSALGIAFVTACAIRGAKKQLLTAAATANGSKVPFTDGDDEKSALEYISKLDIKKVNSIGGLSVQRDEIVRAKTLLKDETGFLAEDLYYTATYTTEYDK